MIKILCCLNIPIGMVLDKILGVPQEKKLTKNEIKGLVLA